jgi:hypothetical protein
MKGHEQQHTKLWEEYGFDKRLGKNRELQPMKEGFLNCSPTRSKRRILH